MKNILIDKQENTAIITFHRPEAMNALNREVLTELNEAIDIVSADDEVRVVVFTGENKAFIAGADVKDMDGCNRDEITEYTAFGAGIFRKVELMSKPTIAAINGYTFGGGFEFALCTDIRIASEKAKFSFPEVKLGIIPGFNGTQRLPRAIGVCKAKELIFTGRMVNAAEACELGLLNKVVSAEELMTEATAIAKLIAANSSSAIAQAKAAVSEGIDTDFDSSMKVELMHVLDCFGTDDQLEGFAAFKEKRAPKFI